MTASHILQAILAISILSIASAIADAAVRKNALYGGGRTNIPVEIDNPVLMVSGLSVFAKAGLRDVNTNEMLADDPCHGSWYSPRLVKAVDCEDILIIDDIKVNVTGKMNTFDHVSVDIPLSSEDTAMLTTMDRLVEGRMHLQPIAANMARTGDMLAGSNKAFEKDYVHVTVEPKHGRVSLNRDYRNHVYTMDGSHTRLSRFSQYTVADTELEASLSSLHYQYEWSPFSSGPKSHGDVINITIEYGNCDVFEKDPRVMFVPRKGRACHMGSFSINVTINHIDEEPVEPSGFSKLSWELLPSLLGMVVIINYVGDFDRRCRTAKYDYERDDEDKEDEDENEKRVVFVDPESGKPVTAGDVINKYGLRDIVVE